MMQLYMPCCVLSGCIKLNQNVYLNLFSSSFSHIFVYDDDGCGLYHWVSLSQCVLCGSLLPQAFGGRRLSLERGWGRTVCLFCPHNKETVRTNI